MSVSGNWVTRPCGCKVLVDNRKLGTSPVSTQSPAVRWESVETCSTHSSSDVSTVVQDALDEFNA